MTAVFIGFLYVFSNTLLAVNTKIALNDEISTLNETLQSRRAEINKLKEQAEQYQQQIRGSQAKANTLKNEVQILDAQIAKFSIEIKAKEQEIALTELNISDIEDQIKTGEARIVEQKAKIAAILRELYQSNTTSDLEILLLNNSLSDFFNQVKFAEDLHTGLHKQLVNFKATVDNLALARANLEIERKILLTQKTELEQKKYNLQDQEKTKNSLLLATKSSERKFRSLVADLKEQEKRTDNEIITLERTIREKLEKEEKDKKLRERGIEPLRWPVPKNFITAYFHDPDYPFRYIFEHSAIDIRASQGTEIKAAASGYVAKTRTDPGCRGSYAYIMIIHANGLSTIYGHVNKIFVSEGDFVVQGDPIGASGAMPGTCGSGPFTTGPHMHFEVRLNGIPVDPLGYLN